MADVARPSPFTLRAAFRRQWVLTCALLTLAVIGVIGAFGFVTIAGASLAVLLALLAAARAILPVQTVGALAVRSRAVDVTVLAILAVGIALLLGTPNLSVDF